MFCRSAPNSTGSMSYSTVSSPDAFAQLAFKALKRKKELRYSKDLEHLINNAHKKKKE
jgi:hypothetical protein